ncbi:hypothetical protein A2765_06190 [Candidatus Kaiserbacteria bacterium RIFCSPHIGHO2_01_FULL_56_24]|uniref:Restriction endonuclease type IV Mrr domain-containing protein n=1 Tax=Candidatus Kaiserbacteria bacterium RIFCSPHIGHO2_01_FULL_56_24 TaxID=1798487 RepID=A0A1F6D8Q3_9BACT|nr:MAG: hypothetical protein A2765_06190 [Candidatus Kaiserbacteria bacterium RIFCSPHIGHO2_01_FULL_56_24]
MREKFVQDSIVKWLQGKQYVIHRVTDKVHGIDIKAYNNARHYYFIECKGETKGENSNLDFSTAMGQILLRMVAGKDSWKSYCIGIPDIREFTNQYAKFLKLPLQFRKQLKISFFFVDASGSVVKKDSWLK